MSMQEKPSEHQSPRTRRSQAKLSARNRKPRLDAGLVQFTPRDEMALAWIGEQYAIRLDHLQRLLARPVDMTEPGPGQISPEAAREVYRRWIRGAWASARIVHPGEPAWVWPTGLGLHKAQLAYPYRNMGKVANGRELAHLYDINEVRLHLDENKEKASWTSERQLLQGVQRIKGKTLLHRPDGELHYQNGEVIAIEVELSKKNRSELDDNLVELLRGEKRAREMSQGAQSQYSAIWYFAPEPVRKHLWSARERLVRQGDVSAEEALRLLVYRYPPARSDEEIRQEEQEDEQARQHESS